MIAFAQTLLRSLVLPAALVISGAALAQPYPSKPIRVIVPSAAGGATDVLTRVIAQKMLESWGQQVIADNRPGANTMIGAQVAAKAAPDGYTLLMALDSTLTMNQSLYGKIGYDPIRDFAPVTRTVVSPLILIVDAEKGANSIKDLIQRAKASPGKLTFGTGTPTTRLAGEQLKGLTGTDMVSVPFKSSAGTVQGLLSKDVDFIIDGATTGIPHIRNGKFRVLASLSSQPIENLPNLPSLAVELGLADFDVSVWLGLVAPAGTPPEIVAKLNQEVVRILALPDVRERLSNVGLIPATNTAAEFGAFIRSESERWGRVIKQAGIKID